MNERIKQLALQSQLVYETTDGKVYNSWEDYVDLTEYVEKFAELIVEECVKVAHPKLTDVGEWAAGMRLVQQRLKQHFGVEE